MDFIFQKFCNYLPPVKLKTKFKKKFFYFVFSIFKFFLKGPFKLNFGNFFFYAFPQKGDYSRYMLTRAELPDPKEREIIKQNLNSEKNLFIDCGANAGFYTLDIWTSVKNCKVYAFEPSLKERYFLNENLKLNNIHQIQVVKYAVADKNGLAFFNDTRNHNYDSSIGGGYITEKELDQANSYEVKLITLDNYFRNKEKEIDNANIFIKVDIEGYDFKAIRGAKNLIIKNNCSVIFEFSKMIVSQEDYQTDYLQDFFKEGFEIYNVHGEKLSMKQLEKKLNGLDEAHDTCGNFFLTKKKLKFTF